MSIPIGDDEIKQRLHQMIHQGHSADECHYRQDMQWLLDEIQRLRTENAEAHQHLRNLIDQCKQRGDKITFAEAKLAKDVAALEAIERFQPNPNNPMDPYKQIAIASKGIARQTLKEISE